MHFHKAAGNQIRAERLLIILEVILLQEFFVGFLELLDFLEYHRECDRLLEYATVNFVERLRHGLGILARQELHSCAGTAVLGDAGIRVGRFLRLELASDNSLDHLLRFFDSPLIIDPIDHDIVKDLLNLLADCGGLVFVDGAEDLRTERLLVVDVHHLAHLTDASGEILVLPDFLLPEVVESREIRLCLRAVMHVFLEEFRDAFRLKLIETVVVEETVRILAVQHALEFCVIRMTSLIREAEQQVNLVADLVPHRIELAVLRRASHIRAAVILAV